MRKRQQQPPRLINFAKTWSEHVLKINTESYNIWESWNRKFLNGRCELVIRASEPPRPDRVKVMGKFSNDSLCQKCPDRVRTTRGGENSHQLHLGCRSTIKEALKAHIMEK